MRHDLIIRPEAEAELADAYAWYDQRVQGLGNQFLLSVDAVFQAVVRASGVVKELQGLAERYFFKARVSVGCCVRNAI